jgi:hypothetical protein
MWSWWRASTAEWRCLNDPQGEIMQKAGLSLFVVVVAAALMAAPSSPVQAETGPCRPDQFSGLTCGEGVGAARVIDRTLSPSRRLAFAWRAPNRAPTEAPDGDPVESLLIRLADGAVLAKHEGGYWNTGELVASRFEQAAAWSPDGRSAVEITDFRWSTLHLRLYAVAADDGVRVLDLRTVIEPAVRKQLLRNAKSERGYDFAVYGSADGKPPRVTIDDSGMVRALVAMVLPKQDASVLFDVVFRVAQKDGVLAAREVSVRRARRNP